MKRLLNVAGRLVGLLALIALAVALALTLGGLRRGTELGAELAFQSFRSPIETPTQPPYPPPGTPTPSPYPPRTPGPPPPSPTPRPTPTRPPEPPTRTPTSIFTPAPPTPTPEPLPTLIAGLETFLYATTGEKYPEIYRIQADPTSGMVGPAYRVHTADLWHSRTYLEGLYPSPDGKRVTVAWVYGEGGNFVSILDVNDGRFTQLLGKEAETRQLAIFLDWSPDGNSVLVLGFSTNPDLGDSAWLVDVQTHEYREVDIKQVSDPQRVFSASFSPDGKAVAYAQTDGYRCGSKVWCLAVDGSDRQLLYEDLELRVEDVLWSPDGSHIAFTQWRETSDFDDFALGELWVMKADGSERRLLSPAMTGYYKKFVPVWSPNGRQIAFVKGSGSGKDLEGLSSNLYAVDVLSGKVSQLTHFQDAQVLGPIWSPDGSMVAFVASLDGSTEQFEPWVVATDARDLHRLDESAALVMDSRRSNPTIAWLPAPLPGGEGQ